MSSRSQLPRCSKARATGRQLRFISPTPAALHSTNTIFGRIDSAVALPVSVPAAAGHFNGIQPGFLPELPSEPQNPPICPSVHSFHLPQDLWPVGPIRRIAEGTNSGEPPDEPPRSRRG